MVEEFIEWSEIYRKPFIQEITFQKYTRTAEILRERFGDTPIDDITRRDIQKLFNDLSNKYQKLTIKTILQHVQGFYQELVDEGKLKINICKNIKFSGVEKDKKKKYLEVEDVEKLSEYLDGNQRYDLMVLTALKTGLRFAEVMGITPNDLTVEDGVYMMSINKSMDYKVDKGQFKTTKTSTSMRDIPIDVKLYELLMDYSLSNKIAGEQSIFGVVAAATVNRRLAKQCNKLGIDPISFHGLRHTHGSILLMQGVPIISVSKRLGHADTNITQSIYIHLMQEQENEDNVTIIKLMEDL